MKTSSVKKIGAWILFAALLLAAVEAASRTYLVIAYRISFWHPRQLLYEFYPELKAVDRCPLSGSDTCYDILLLGGSVLTPMFGDIPLELEGQFSRALHRKVRIFNLSQLAHGILDSYYKYRFLSGKRFDLVILYHAINDVRANNCPAGVFRDDFAHYAWYSRVNVVARDRMIRLLSFPVTFRLATEKVLRKASGKPLLPEKSLPEAWRAYGADIKTERTFRSCLECIVHLARRKRETVALMTFAYYIPANYSPAAFQSHQLDYGAHAVPVELWGVPDNVRKGIDAHNRIIRQIHQSDAGPVFVDQERLMPKEGAYFDDVAHLTRKGCALFARNIVEAVLARRVLAALHP